MNKKVKFALIGLGALVAFSATSYLAIFIATNSAANDFREQASKQLSSAISGKVNDSPIEVANIPLGSLINSDYRNIYDSQKTYKELLTDVQHYAVILPLQNQLTEYYNKNFNSNPALDPDILALTNKYLAAVKNYFPDEKSRISELEDLSDKITASTDFSDISADISQTLQDNATWINEQKDQLNTRINQFQSAVNE